MQNVLLITHSTHFLIHKKGLSKLIALAFIESLSQFYKLCKLCINIVIIAGPFLNTITTKILTKLKPFIV